MILHTHTLTYTHIISFEHNYQYMLTRCKLVFFFLTVLGLSLPCVGFLELRRAGAPLVAVFGLIIAVACLVAEHRL